MEMQDGYVSKILLRDYLPPITKDVWKNRNLTTPPRVLITSKNKYLVQSNEFDISQSLDPIEVKIECSTYVKARELSTLIKECMKKNVFIELETGVLSKGGGEGSYRNKVFKTKTRFIGDDLIDKIKSLSEKSENNKFSETKTSVQGFMVHGFDTTYTLIDYTLKPNSYNEDNMHLVLTAESYQYDDEGEFNKVVYVDFQIPSKNKEDINTLTKKLNDLAIKKESFVTVTGHLPQHNMDNFVVRTNESCADLIALLQKDEKATPKAK